MERIWSSAFPENVHFIWETASIPKKTNHPAWVRSNWEKTHSIKLPDSNWDKWWDVKSTHQLQCNQSLYEFTHVVRSRLCIQFRCTKGRPATGGIQYPVRTARTRERQIDSFHIQHAMRTSCDTGLHTTHTHTHHANYSTLLSFRLVYHDRTCNLRHPAHRPTILRSFTHIHVHIDAATGRTLRTTKKERPHVRLWSTMPNVRSAKTAAIPAHRKRPI